MSTTTGPQFVDKGKQPLPGMVQPNTSKVSALKSQFEQMQPEEVALFITEALKQDDDENGVPDVLESHGQFTIQDLLAVVKAMKEDDDPTNDEKASMIERIIEKESKVNDKIGDVLKTIQRLPLHYWLPWNPERQKDVKKGKNAKEIHVVHSFKLW
jgi:hypothetical protein